MNLDWVVKKAIEKISRLDVDIQNEIQQNAAQDPFSFSQTPFTPQDYRLMIIKNLIFIQTLRPKTRIDWKTIELYYPNLNSVTLDLTKDTKDMSFYDSHKYKDSLEYKMSSHDRPEYKKSKYYFLLKFLLNKLLKKSY